jgi:hypothetical protein
LKFLLQQSDIFTHFGVSATKKSDSNASSAASSSSSNSKNSRHKVVESDELDDDERAMAEETDGTSNVADTPTLTVQPSCITGQMK